MMLAEKWLVTIIHLKLSKPLQRWVSCSAGKVYWSLKLCISLAVLQRQVISSEGHILKVRLFPEPIYSVLFLSLSKGNYNNYLAGELILK